MAREAAPVVDVVGPDYAPGDFLEQVIFLVGAPGRAEKPDALGAVLFLDPAKAAHRKLKRFLPGYRNEIRFRLVPRFTNQGAQQACVRIQEIMGEMPPDAKRGFVDGFRASGRVDLHHFISGDAHGQTASHRAKTARGIVFPLRGADIRGVSNPEGARGADGDAGTAKGAARFLQPGVVNRGGPGTETPVRVVDGAHHHQLVVRPDAFAAQNAFAQIPGDERIGLLERFEIGHRIQAGFPHAEGSGHPPQCAPVSFAANHAGFRVFRDYEADDVAAVIEDARGLGQDRLSGRRGRDAGGHEPPGLFILHQTESARARRLQVGVMAEPGDSDPVAVRRLKNARPRRGGDGLAVD